MTQSFAPQESSTDLFIERALFSGSVVANVVYGEYLYNSALKYYVHIEIRSGVHVCVVTMIFFASKEYTGTTTKFSRLLSCAVFLLFAMATIEIACEERFFEIMWIDQRDIPGGPIAWTAREHSIVSGILGNSAFCVASFTAEIILVSKEPFLRS